MKKPEITNGQHSIILPSERLSDPDDIYAETDLQKKTREHLGLIIGDDLSMLHMWRDVRYAARNRKPSLVMGDVGVGKELVARAIGELRQRMLGRNIDDIGIVNATTVNEPISESLLFGHERGAFTHADTKRKGEFHNHVNGIVVLDEIGNISRSLQDKMLRVMESPFTFRPVGAMADIEFTGKAVAVTNLTMQQLRDEQHMRQDFLSRLTAGEIVRVPDLSERSGTSIIMMINHFVESFGKTDGQCMNLAIDQSAAEVLSQVKCENNMRDIRSITERACVYAIDAERRTVTMQDIDRAVNKMQDILQNKRTGYFQPKIKEVATGQLESSLNSAEKLQIMHALELNKFNRSQTAKALGISRVTLYNKMIKHRMANTPKAATRTLTDMSEADKDEEDEDESVLVDPITTSTTSEESESMIAPDIVERALVESRGSTQIADAAAMLRIPEQDLLQLIEEYQLEGKLTRQPASV